MHLYFYNVLKRKLKNSTQEATYNFLRESPNDPHSTWYGIDRIPAILYIATKKSENLVLHMVENQRISFTHVKCFNTFLNLMRASQLLLE